MKEAQRRLSYNVNIGSSNNNNNNTCSIQQHNKQSEKQKFLNRTSNCYENSRIKYGPTDDYDLDELDINVADINYEDDDIFGDEDDTTTNTNKETKYPVIKSNTIPNKHILKPKTSSESSASTSTSSISASSSSANAIAATTIKPLPNHYQLKQNNNNDTKPIKETIQSTHLNPSPFTSSNSSMSYSTTTSHYNNQIKKYKHSIPEHLPLPPPPPPPSSQPLTTTQKIHNKNIYMLKKSTNQLSSDANSIVVTNKTEFKFVQPSSSSPTYSTSSSPSPSSVSQPPSPQQQQQQQLQLTTPAQIMSPPPPPPSTDTITYQLMPTLANFSHFDLQSVLFNYESVKQIKDTLHKSINTRTGASAASRQSSFENLNKTLPASNSNNNVLLGKDYLISNQISNEPEHHERKKSTNICDPNSSKRLSTSLFVYLNEEVNNNNNNKRLSDSLYNKNSDLVEECAPFFKLELGGDTFKGLGLVDEVSQRRMMKLNSISCLDKINTNFKKEIIDLIESNNSEAFTIEYQDYDFFC